MTVELNEYGCWMTAPSYDQAGNAVMRRAVQANEKLLEEAKELERKVRKENYGD